MFSHLGAIALVPPKGKKNAKKCQKVALRGFKKVKIDRKMSWYPHVLYCYNCNLDFRKGGGGTSYYFVGSFKCLGGPLVSGPLKKTNRH